MDESSNEKKVEEKTIKATVPSENSPDLAQTKDNSTLIFIIIAAVLIIVLLALVFIPKYLEKQKLQDSKYNGFSFVEREDGFWYTVVNKGNQPFSIPFYYHPKDLEDIIIEPNIRDKFFNMRDKNGTVYISIDPDSENNKVVIAGVEIARILGDRYGLLNVKTHSGFLRAPTSATTNTLTPIITCENANETTLVVGIVVTNANIVSSQGNCLILQAKSYNETVEVADRLVYHILGIMN